MNKSYKIFTQILKAIEKQYKYDLEHASKLSDIYNDSDINMYNNTCLVDSLLHVICSWFKDLEYTMKEIQVFMYDLDFGNKVPGDSLLHLWTMLMVHEAEQENLKIKNCIPEHNKLYCVRLGPLENYSLCLYNKPNRIFKVVNEDRKRSYDVDYTNIEFFEANIKMHNNAS